MRVGMIPDSLLDWLLSRANALPFPIADTLVAMLQARAIMAANQLGVFRCLSDGPASVREIAERVSCSEQGVRCLMEALSGCGYVKETGGKYRLSRRAAKWLVGEDFYSLSRFIDFNYDNWNLINQLEEAVRKGRSLDIHAQLKDPESWRRYLYGLHDLSKMGARELVLRVRLKPGQNRILDIGGGHGAYVAAYCRRYPGLKGVILDLAPAVEIGKEIIGKYYRDVADRIEFRPGDLTKEPFDGGYDAVLVFNMIHHFPPEMNRRTFKKVFEALNKGGRAIVLDYLKDGSQTEVYLAGLSQLLFLVMSGAGTHTLDEVRGWLLEAGFPEVRSKSFQILRGTSLVIATKK